MPEKPHHIKDRDYIIEKKDLMIIHARLKTK
jgi:hypothetical protein